MKYNNEMQTVAREALYLCLMKYNNEMHTDTGSLVFVRLMKYSNEMHTVAREARVCCYLLVIEL